MNEIKVFENPEFGKVRTMVINEKPYFAGSDVAKVLGYARPRKAILDHCRGVLKRDGVSLTTNQYGTTTEQAVEMSFISESDVYRLIMKSNLPNAERFQDWVVEEVLPSIRKHGAYMTPEKIEEVLLNPDTVIKLATSLKAEQEKTALLEAKIEKDKPYTEFGRAISVADTEITIGELAKIICQNGYEIGRTRLFQYLRDNGYLITYGQEKNLPKQHALESGMFKIRVLPHWENGEYKPFCKTMVTPKGQIYFVNRFLDEREEK